MADLGGLKGSLFRRLMVSEVFASSWIDCGFGVKKRVYEGEFGIYI
jgi:hypothetical protein